jgi:hypothetical protein
MDPGDVVATINDFLCVSALTLEEKIYVKSSVRYGI